MAEKWSGYDNSGSNGMRAGLVWSVPSVSHNTSSITISFEGWTGNRYNYSDNGQTLIWSGDITGTDTFNNTQGSGSKTRRATRSVTYNYPSNSYGSSPGSVTVKIRVGYSYNGSHPEVSVTVPIPARPYAKPAAPSSVTVTRNSDSRATVSWSRNATSGEPYTSQTVQRQTGTDETWRTVATVSGGSTSWTDNGLSGNEYWRYRVRANNSKGSSGYAYSDGIRTSPAAPSNVKAATISGGASIRLTWTVRKSYAAGDEDIQRQVNGGAWTTVASVNDTGSWTDTSPGAGTNRYRIRENVISQGQQMYSAWVESNTVSTIVPPLAPTNLRPNGQIFDATNPITLSWQHSPGGDGADQDAFQVRYSVDGGASTTLTKWSDTDQSSWPLPGGTLPNGHTCQWQVRTWGAHADPSPWSASATIITSATPTVTLTVPATAEVITSLPVVAEWTFNQDEGLTQAGWQAEVRDSDGTVVASGTGTTQDVWAVPLSAALEDGQTYTVRVRGRANTIWSDWDERTFTVDLLPPAEATITPTFDPESGTMILDLHAGEPEPGVSNDIDTVAVQRRIDGGPWVTLFEGVSFDDGSDMTVLDTLPSLKAVHEYRLVVTSISPSTAITDPVQIETFGFRSTRWGFLSFGEGFTTILRGMGNPSLSDQPDRARGAMAAAGRRFPILLVGDQRTRTRSVSLLAMWDEVIGGPGPSSTDHEWIDAGLEAGIVCWRDWRGDRIFGRLDGMQVTPQIGDTSAEVSFSVEMTDFHEGV